MTNEEAIKVLNMVEAHGLADEAKKTAIKALESQDTKSITLSIDEKYLKKLTDKAVQDAVEEIRQEMLCGDAISRKQACDLALNSIDKSITPNDIMRMPSVIPKQRWIPVSERLPKESDGTVLITVNGQVRTGQYSEFNNTWYKGDMCGVGGDDPIAWMPLPKPYKVEPQESEEGA